MNETVLLIMGIVVGVLVMMFILAFVALALIKRKHARNRFNSLPAGGTDGSEYGEMLVQKYKNQRLEGEL